MDIWLMNQDLFHWLPFMQDQTVAHAFVDVFRLFNRNTLMFSKCSRKLKRYSTWLLQPASKFESRKSATEIRVRSYWTERCDKDWSISTCCVSGSAVYQRRICLCPTRHVNVTYSV